MLEAKIGEDRVVLSNVGRQSNEWWEMLLNRLRSHHIPSLCQRGRRMWADARGNAIVYLTTETVSREQAAEILKHSGFDVSRT